MENTVGSVTQSIERRFLNLENADRKSSFWRSIRKSRRDECPWLCGRISKAWLFFSMEIYSIFTVSIPTFHICYPNTSTKLLPLPSHLVSDVPEANAHCLSLIGTALLTTLEVLIEHNLFTPPSSTNPIRNIGFVLAQFLKSDTAKLDSELCRGNETGWLIEVVKMADEHKVEIKGVFGIEERLRRIRDAAATQKPKQNRKPAAEKKRAWTLGQDFNSQGKRLWRKWDWKREVCIITVSSLESSWPKEHLLSPYPKLEDADLMVI